MISLVPLFVSTLSSSLDASIAMAPPTIVAVTTPDTHPRPGGRPVGGTPEPATMLLLTGGAIAYAASMAKRRKDNPPKDV